jgi:hypothetical protein
VSERVFHAASAFPPTVEVEEAWLGMVPECPCGLGLLEEQIGQEASGGVAAGSGKGPGLSASPGAQIFSSSLVADED